MVNAAAWLYAAGEYAAKQGSAERLFKSAATLTGQARQQELTAWELGAREAIARKASQDGEQWWEKAQRRMAQAEVSK